MTEDTKRTIDAMSYTAMLRAWRHSPSGLPLFQSDTGDYFAKAMKKKRKEVGDAAHVAASKSIGWMLLFVLLLK